MFIQRSVLVTALVLTASAGAQAPSEAQMQQMMQQAQAMQDCMANVDPRAMEALQADGEKMETELRALCAAGKRDEAQRRAVELGRKMAGSPALKEMAKCGDLAKGMLPPMAARAAGEGAGAGHVCDGF